MALSPKAHGFASPASLASTAKDTRRRTTTAIVTSDLFAIVAFSLIGLLLVLLGLGVMVRFPDLGAVIEQYNQF